MPIRNTASANTSRTPSGSADRPGEGDRDAKRRRKDKADGVTPKRARRNRDRGEAGRDAEDQQKIGDIASDDIADGDAVAAQPCGLDRCDEFGKGCTEAHKRQADHQRGDTEAGGQRHRAAHEKIAPEEKPRETGDKKKGCHAEKSAPRPRPPRPGVPRSD